MQGDRVDRLDLQSGWVVLTGTHQNPRASSPARRGPGASPIGRTRSVDGARGSPQVVPRDLRRPHSQSREGSGTQDTGLAVPARRRGS